MIVHVLKMDSTQQELKQDKPDQDKPDQDKLDQEKGDKSNCSICWEELSSDIKYLNCAHSFHGPCIYNWLELNATCPLCRTDVSYVPEPSTYVRNDGIVYDYEQSPHNNIASGIVDRLALPSATFRNRLALPTATFRNWFPVIHNRYQPGDMNRIDFHTLLKLGRALRFVNDLVKPLTDDIKITKHT